MASVVVTFRIMPKSPEINLEQLNEKAKKVIADFTQRSEFKTSIQPVAFGLKSLNIIFVTDEEKGDTEELEKEVAQLDGVESVEVTDVRRAIG